MSLFFQEIGSIPFSSKYYAELASNKLLLDKGISNLAEGYAYALYEKDYAKLIAYTSDNFNKKHPRELEKDDLVKAIIASGCKLTKYFNDEVLPQFELDIEAFNQDQRVLQTRAGIKAIGEGHLNLLVINGEKCYMHPKVRATPGDFDKAGISHSSFTRGHRVKFAATMVLTEDDEGWILRNRSGHFAPLPIQLRTGLLTLQAMGMNIASLRVEILVAKDASRTDFDSCYIENAKTFLDRINRSIKAVERQILAKAKDLTGEPVEKRTPNLMRKIHRITNTPN